MPSPGGSSRVPGFPVNSGQIETEGGLLVRLILGGYEPIGLSFVASMEGFLFTGDEVLRVIHPQGRRNTR